MFFVKQKRKILEAHILNFEKDIYGENIAIVLMERIRDAKKFANDKDLIKQIKKDIRSITN